MADHTAPTDPLGIIDDVRARAAETLALASQHLDPSLVDVLSIIGYDYDYTTARGSLIYDLHGREFLDFHSGEGFATLGRNHPDIRAVIKATLDEELLDGVQIQYSPLAGMLAEAITARLPRSLDAVFFGSTGAEMVDSAMKFARAATGRKEIVSTLGGYHGVTYGPLSIVGEDFFKEGFGPLLPGCRRVPHGDLDALEKVLKNAASRRSSSSRSRGWGSTRRRRATWRASRSSAADTGHCSCSTRCRPAWLAPAAGSRSSTGTSSRTSSRSPRRCRAATCRPAR